MSRKSLVPIVLPADPAAAMEAATKQYVDAQVGGGGGTSEVEIGPTDPIATNPSAELWWDTDAVATPWVPSSASETTKGVVELATQAETDARTDNTRAVTPASLASLASLPRGVIARTWSVQNEGAVITTTPVVLAKWKSVPLVVGRLYRAEWQFRAIQSAVSAYAIMRPLTGQNAAVGMQSIDILPMSIYGTYGAGAFNTILEPTATGTYDVGVMISAGGGNITLYAGSAWFIIEDIGLAVPAVSGA